MWMRYRRMSGAYVAALTLFVPFAAIASECTCADVKDLQNRLGMAHAAIDEFEQQRSQHSRATTIVPTGNLASLKNRVRETQALVQRGPTGDGETFVTCAKSVRGATACLKPVLDVHEDMHVAKCGAEKGTRNLGTLDDRWVGRPLHDYIDEEIAGYRIEVAEITKRLQALPKSCRPSGWVGTIRVLQVVETSGRLVSPPRPGAKYADPTVETFSESVRRWGTVHYSTSPVAYWGTQQMKKKATVSGMLESCRGGLKPAVPDRRKVNTTESEASGEITSGEVVPNVSVSFEPMRYTIGLNGPKVEGQITFKSSQRSTGGCNNDGSDVPEMRVDGNVGELDWLTVTDRMLPGDRYIGGSKTIDLLQGQIPGGGNANREQVPGVDRMFNTVTVYWHLHTFD